MPGPREVLYGAVERVFRRLPPFTAHRLLALSLRAAGVRRGDASVFWGAPTLAGEGEFCARLSIGAHCGFNVGCYFELDAPVTIGDHVSVGHDVMFLTRTHDTSRPERRAAATGGAPITIGDGAWLGARCVILPGITVGAGAVVGASVVVDKNIPADVMLAGNRRISIAKWR